MKVLALCPYYGGSHEQFLKQWMRLSRHRFTVCSLPPRHLKWRMRQAAVGLAEQAARLSDAGHRFDAIFTTSLCNAAELRGLLPRSYRSLPLCVYFHENQFGYPSRSAERDKERGWDVNLPLNNWISCLAADELWFNSSYNRRSLLEGMGALLRRMPDEKSLHTLELIRERAMIEAPGIDFDFFRAGSPRTSSLGRPLTVAWVARWEHDKRPDLFVQAALEAAAKGAPFELICLGQRFKKTEPPEFTSLKALLKDRILYESYASSGDEYRKLLHRTDVVVSTAEHEFFGIAVLEAVASGCIPLVPDRLVYRDLYPSELRYPADTDAQIVRGVAERLKAYTEQKMRHGALEPVMELEQLARSFDWKTRAPCLDEALERMARDLSGSTSVAPQGPRGA